MADNTEFEQYRMYVWVWIATVINAPSGPFTTTATLTFLTIIGNTFCTLFPKQSPKILRVLLSWFRELEVQPLHSIGGAEGKTALYNTFTLLESWNSTSIIPVHPGAILPPAQESSTQYEEITSEDLTTFS
uniref:Uncharacterized protein n=1 Tax=Lygus hesperus TaxID=30085 RepID=A0A146L049_LYGHE